MTCTSSAYDYVAIQSGIPRAYEQSSGVTCTFHSYSLFRTFISRMAPIFEPKGITVTNSRAIFEEE